MKSFLKLYLVGIIFIISLAWVNIASAQECNWVNRTSCNLDPNYPYPAIFNSCVGPQLPPPSTCCCKAPQTQVTTPPQTPAEILAQCWTQSECEVDSHGIWKQTDWAKKYCKLPIENPPDMGQCFAANPDLPLQVGIPGSGVKYCSVYTLGEEPINCTAGGNAACAPDHGICKPGIKGGFPGYLAAFYKFFVAALAVIAIVMVMWGGFKRIMAAGAPDKIKGANETIVGAITGVVIALVSFSLLQLVNPRLVENTLPMIQKVKPALLGITCPKYSEETELYNMGYTRLTGRCTGNDVVSKHCSTNADCEGGTCDGIGSLKNEPQFNTCGVKLNFASTDLTCRGVECSKSPGAGCFTTKSITGDSNNDYYCRNFLETGSLAHSGTYAKKMDLYLICNNDTAGDAYNCDVRRPGEDTSLDGIRIDEDQGSYAISQCFSGGDMINPADECSNKGGFKGYALWLDVDYGFLGLGDELYMVDQSSCSATATKPINENGHTDPGDINWQNVSANSLITKTATRCNLNITLIEFPDR